MKTQKPGRWRTPASMTATLILALTASSCAVPAQGGMNEVRNILQDRLPQELHWTSDGDPGGELEKIVTSLLENELTPDAAVQIALIRNPGLQAVYEDLGIAQADLVEAGLPENPRLGVSVRFPGSGSGTNTEIGIAQEFLGILLIPMKRKFSGREFERAQLRVADEIFRFTAQVRAAYYEAVAAREQLSHATDALDAAAAAARFAERQRAAGNLNEMDLLGHLSFEAEEKIAHAHAATDAAIALDNLATLLGTGTRQEQVRLPERLENPPALPTPGAETLLVASVTRRLDLLAAAKETEAIEAALRITRNWRWLGGLEVGVSHERDTDGSSLTGPEFSLELPVFNQKQTDVAKLEAALRRSRRELESRRHEAGAEIRRLVRQLEDARRSALSWRDEIRPRRERVLEETLYHYNGMLRGVYDLLEARRAVAEAGREFTGAVRNYWTLRAELELAAGGPVTGPAAVESPPPEAGPESVTDGIPPHSHH